MLMYNYLNTLQRVCQVKQTVKINICKLGKCHGIKVVGLTLLLQCIVMFGERQCFCITGEARVR